MAKFRESNITDSGLDYARKAANGVIKITFTKAVLSADQHQNDSLQTLQGLTSLNGFVQSDSINYATQASDSNVVLPLRFHNTGMTSDSYINTVGLYASDGNNEVLYSIIVNDDPDLFPAYNGTTPESIKINYETQVGRADQVNVQVSPLGMATEEELQRLITIRALTNDDDVLNLSETGHYTIDGTNPSNNPWNKNIWADVYRTGYNTIVRDNTGNVFIRSNYDSTWKSLLTNIDANSLSNQSQSLADSVAASLGTWNRSGFDSLGGSVAWLMDQNNKRISDTTSVADSLGGFGTWLSSSTNSDVSSLSNQSQSLADSVAASLGTWNRSGFDSLGGSVAWLYGQNNQRMADTASNAVKINSVADSLGDWNRSGFDSLGGSVAWLMTQNSQRISDTTSVADSLGGYGTWLSSSTNTDVTSLASVDSSLNAQIAANESYTSSTAISLADSLGGYGTWLSSSANTGINSLANNKVQDNHDGTVTVNGINYVVTKQLGPNDDVFAIREPGVYTCLWGYQNTLDNFPSTDGAAVIIAQGNSVTMKLTVIDSWGGEYHTTFNNDKYNPWEAAIKQSDINAVNTRINANQQSINNNITNINNLYLLNWEYTSWGLANQNPNNYPDCYYDLKDNTLHLTGSIDVKSGDYVYFLNHFITNETISTILDGKSISISNAWMNNLQVAQPHLYTFSRRNGQAVGFEAKQDGTLDLSGCYIKFAFN